MVKERLYIVYRGSKLVVVGVISIYKLYNISYFTEIKVR